MSNSDYTVHELNVIGLRCPMPLLKLKQCLYQIASGECVAVYASDAGALTDIPAFIRQTSHTLLSQQTLESGDYYFLIRKGE